MGDPRKAFDPGKAERIFDRLTVLVLHHELLLNGVHGPLSENQRKVVTDLLARSKDVAALFRDLVS